MKILLDSNLSRRLQETLTGKFQEIRHVSDYSLDSATDSEIWKFAKTNGFAVITKDADFVNLSLVKGFPPKVIVVGLGNCSTQQVHELIEEKLSDIVAFISDQHEGILVIR